MPTKVQHAIRTVYTALPGLLILTMFLGGCTLPNPASSDIEEAPVTEHEVTDSEQVTTETSESNQTSTEGDTGHPSTDVVSLKGTYKLQLDTDRTYQSIQTFGGSGGWWAQDVGSWTEAGDDSGLPARERVAQLLFDPVEGIGLTSYRYNLGGGSADSEEEAIPDPWRRAHALESEPGIYDWSRDEAAIWMLKAASAYNIEEVVIFSNSPPERMKVNGRTVDDDEHGGNFLPEYYDAFARYALDVAVHFLEQDIPVKYISPVNEPNWQWTGGQEGVQLSAREVVEIYQAFVSEIERRPEAQGIRLSGPESIFMDESNRQYINAIMRNPEITAHMDHFASHAYQATPEIKQTLGYWFRNAYPDFQYRLSEWTEMVNGRDNSMDSGLVLANTIHEDLTLLNVEAWQYWILVSKYDYRDGLIYVDEDRQTLAQTKRLWVMGNYSRYIEKDDVRFYSHMDLSTNVNVSSFQSPAQDRIVFVLVNNNAQSVLVRPELPEWALDMRSEFHVTSRRHNLEQLALEEKDTWHLPPDSVVTVILQ